MILRNKSKFSKIHGTLQVSNVFVTAFHITRSRTFRVVELPVSRLLPRFFFRKRYSQNRNKILKKSKWIQKNQQVYSIRKKI